MNRPSTSRMQPLLATLVLLVAVAACENKVDDAPNRLPSTNDASALDAPADASPTVATCDCLQPGKWFRFDALAVTSLDEATGHPLIGQLNSLWKIDIAGMELNFYFEVVEASATSVKFRVLNGARVGKEDTCLLPKTETTIVFPRSGCSLAKSAPAGINVYAGTEANTKNCAPTLAPTHAIPVRNATLQATVAPDCSAIGDGLVLTGGIAGDALAKTCTCITNKTQTSESCLVPDAKYVDGDCDGCNSKYSNLLGLFRSFSGDKDPDYLCKSETGGPAVCLTATFHAVAIAAAPPVCK